MTQTDDGPPLRKPARDYVDWEAIYAHPPAEQMRVLGELSSLDGNDFTRARLALVGRVVEEEQARHRPGAKARAATILGLTPLRTHQLYEKYRTSFGVVRMAYDFGDQGVHVMDLDDRNVVIEGSVEALPPASDADTALARAGYRRSGPWERHGEAMGADITKIKRTTKKSKNTTGKEQGQ